MPKIEYVADFESTTDAADCRVWAWGLCEVGTHDFEYGLTIDTFMTRLEKLEGARVWFHNAGFDTAFIIDWLCRHSFDWVKDRPAAGQFTTLIDGSGRFYSMEIAFQASRVQICDSWKKLPYKLAAVAKTYGLEMVKGELDYETYRPIGHELTPEELDYLTRDVLILADAMEKRFEMGKKLTTGADCLANYIDLVGGKGEFRRMFPLLNPIMDNEIRQAYRGGYVYCNPLHRNEIVGQGIRLDVNSLYPWAMRTNPMPWGKPQRFTGKPKTSDDLPLWVCEITFSAYLKPGMLPVIQLKNNRFYNDYVAETRGPITLWVTSIDWRTICEMYDVTVYEYHAGYYFHARGGMFDDYIDYGMQGKVNAKTKGERTNYKLWLNNLYGKFGTNPQAGYKKPVLMGDTVEYPLGGTDERDSIYIPVAAFITAFARRKTITSAVEFGERFCYCDTDSIHAIGTGIPADIEVHESALGAWKLEATFERAKFLRAKTYVETVNGIDEFTCAGMSDGLKSVMEFDDFTPGFTTDRGRAELEGRDIAEKYFDPKIQKLVPEHVPGGVILVPRPFTIHV